MNHDETTPDVHPLIEPELEARMVAWVAGEASPFESAELERLLAEKPELAIFKRRIEAVHQLVAVAARPDPEPLRLAPERREKLLRTLAAGHAPGASAAVSKKTDAPAVFPSHRAGLLRRNRWRQTATVAAGLMLGLFFSALIRYSSIKHVPETIEAERNERIERDAIVLSKEPAAGPSKGEQAQPGRLEQMKVQLETALGTPSSSEVANVNVPRLEKPRGPNPVLFGIGSPAGVINGLSNASSVTHTNVAEQQALSAKLAARRSDGTPDDGAVVLSPFMVSAPPESYGYMASSTLAGSRIRTDLKDIGGAINLGPPLVASAPSEAKREDRSKETDDKSAAQTESDGEAASSGAANRTPSAAPASPTSVQRSGSVSESFAASNEVLADLKTSKAKAATGLGDSEAVVDSVKISDNPRPADEVTAARQAASSDSKKQIAEPAKADPAQDLRTEISAAKQAVSTFSLHVSDVSFRLAQAALARGELPEPDSIRPEEFYNAFNYGDPAPAMAEKIACRVEQSRHPSLQQRNLMRIAMKVPAVGRGVTQPLYLTVLLDTSGSMEREDRAAAVHRAMEVLVSLLGPSDRLTVIGFARQPRLLVDQLPGDRASEALTAIAHTPAEGGTDLEAALALASDLALRHREQSAQNRIVLLTDGAANLGNANPAQLASSIEALRQQGIAFDACGVGLDGIDDAMLERLTRKGDGRYYVLNTPEAADAGFARQLAGAFRPAALNVKVQVRFNPSRVGAYRLIGFEQHRLKEEDFRNDRVDAAELAADEAAIAVYQVETLPQGEGDLGEVYVRFRDAFNGNMVERSWPMPYDPQAAAFDRATPAMQLAGVSALIAEKLSGGPSADLIKLDQLAPVVNALRGAYAHEPRVQELVTMYQQLRRLKGE